MASNNMGSSWTVVGSDGGEGPGLAEDAAHIGGDQLADLLARRSEPLAVGAAHDGQASAPARGTSLAAQIQRAREAEQKHELIALHNGSLVLNYSNYRRFRASCDSKAPTTVVSFLGDTAVGKSTIIREVMGMAGGDERPFVQRAVEQGGSTTFNVNLYPSSGLLPGLTVNFLDFEGEGGSAEPAMAQPRQVPPSRHAAPRFVPPESSIAGSLVGSAGKTYARGALSLPGSYAELAAAVLPPMLSTRHRLAAADDEAASSLGEGTSILERAREVRESFPRLAYATSDIVVLVGTEKLFGSRYLERALSFAKQANTNIQDVERPALIIISNKVDVDECCCDIHRTTTAFQEHMGRDVAQLDGYFSVIMVIQCPNTKTSAVTEEGSMRLGQDEFASQIDKLRTALQSVLHARLAEHDARLTESLGAPARRVITSRAGLWYALLPRIVVKLNSGEPVHVTRLLDEAWSESVTRATVGSAATGGGAEAEAPLDVHKTFVTYLRPPPALSQAAMQPHEDYLDRFVRFHSLAMDVAAVLAAARLRCIDPALLLDDRVAAAARPQLEAVAALLASLVPCCAVYGEGHRGPAIELGEPVDRPGQPVLCLQERRVHPLATHRGARLVRGGGPSLWARLWQVLPYNPVWSGAYAPARIPLTDPRALLGDVLALVHAPSEEGFTAAALLALQEGHSSGAVAIEFAPLEPAPPACVPGPLRLRAAPLASPLMPYCVRCARRCGSAVAPALTRRNDEQGAAAAGMLSVDSTAGGAAAAAAASLGYIAWVRASLGQLLPKVAAEARHALGWGSGDARGSAVPATASAATGTDAVEDGGPDAALSLHPHPRAVSFRSAEGGGGVAASIVGSATTIARRGGLKKAAPGCPLATGEATATHAIVFGVCNACLAHANGYNAAATAAASDAYSSS